MAIASTLQALHTFAADSLGPIGTAAAVLFGLLYVGVILPAVWSRHHYRRTAAQRTLSTLLAYLDTLLRALRRTPPR